MSWFKGAKVPIFLLIFSFLFVQAGAVNDFSATAGAGFSECSCSTVQGAINVRNTGDSLSSFFVSQSGPLAEFSTVFPDSFVLAPGEEIAVNEYLRIPCGAEGKYSLVTNIRTGLGVQRQIAQEISAVKCATANAAVLPSQVNKKLIIFLLLAFFLILLVILILALTLLTRKPSSTEKRPEKKPKKGYWWEEYFARKEKEKDEQVYRKFLKKSDNKPLRIILLLIVAILLISFIANYIIPPSANSTINATNMTFLPFGAITTSTFKPEVMQAENVTFINPAEFAISYASFIISGIVVLLALIFGIRFMREREKNGKNSKIDIKISGKKFFIILLVLAVLAAIAVALFYGSRLSEGKNATAAIFSEESAETIKSYIPYIILGIMILGVIILFLKLVERKKQ